VPNGVLNGCAAEIHEPRKIAYPRSGITQKTGFRGNPSLPSSYCTNEVFPWLSITYQPHRCCRLRCARGLAGPDSRQPERVLLTADCVLQSDMNKLRQYQIAGERM
jgi:hypothetical protein